VEVGEELITPGAHLQHKRLRFIVHLCRGGWLLRVHPRPLQANMMRWVEPEQLADFPFPAPTSGSWRPVRALAEAALLKDSKKQ